ncbi:tRNA (N6-threonylcarbamoyladenosine(37)-N6)-methyltransferase TrmO [Porticoccaceae bacterium LTM1]|nr:tRNA (N6-threonylcarbamoyladenosine(37)-N6)-methyltransferase TrmO [Porticoccaceae bacterium LTM1]
MATFQFDTIGIVHSPYKEKFAVPRQPGIVSSAKGQIELLPPYNDEHAIRDLEQFSHLWVLFVFHGTQDQGWKPLVRPPRLGGNTKTGVFSTRSTFRPNPIGMSVVSLEGIKQEGQRVFIEIAGMDLLDGTPVIDIKPYIPYSDSLPGAHAGYAADKPAAIMTVEFSAEAESILHKLNDKHPHLKDFISDVLAQDPRPAYRNASTENRQYGVRLYDINVVWEVVDGTSRVIRIEEV